MNRLLLIFVLTLFGGARDLNEKGNKFYHKEKYDEALKTYKEAQVKDPKLMRLDYNIGCAQYKVKSHDEALKAFTKIISSLESEELKEKSCYNSGNAMFKLGDLEKAIEMYKQALRMNSEDLDAKINLEFAQKMLEESKKQKGEQKEQKDKSEKDKKKSEKKEKPKIPKDAAKSLLEALKHDEMDAKEKSQAKSRKGRVAVLRDW